MSVSIDQGTQEGTAEESLRPGAVPSHLERAYVEVTLEGGPAGIPRIFRIDEAAFAYGKVKIPRNNGYEHYERPRQAGPGAISGDDPLVFRWTNRTKIAE